MSDQLTIMVHPAPQPTLSQRPVEMCEHKGIGHPDTLTDGACEVAAIALAKAYISVFGKVLHFNVDKGLLIAGQSAPCFGGGSILEPIRLIVCGRAANPDGKLDIEGIVTNAVREYLEGSVGCASKHFHIFCEIKEGSENLKQIYAESGLIRRANDTSFGVGYAPFSELERDVLDLATIFCSTEFYNAFPAAGRDFKIMGVRSGREHAATIALAMIDRHVSSANEYFGLKRAIHQHLAERCARVAEITVNALDDSQATTVQGLYLTVTGLSAEMGDDGQVGRGNRVNGLITPGRLMSMEAAAGKNPVCHVGKIYNVLANLIAQQVCDDIVEVAEANVQIVSRIGQPLEQPWMVVVEVAPVYRLTKSMQVRIKAIVTARLGAIDSLVDQLIGNEIKVY